MLADLLTVDLISIFSVSLFQEEILLFSVSSPLQLYSYVVSLESGNTLHKKTIN